MHSSLTPSNPTRGSDQQILVLEGWMKAKNETFLFAKLLLLALVLMCLRSVDAMDETSEFVKQV